MQKISEEQILQQYHSIAIVGFSTNPSRASYGVAAYLQQQGYTIIPINPRLAGQTALGRPIYATLSDAVAAGEKIEIVDVFRRAEDVPPIAREAVQIGARVLWLQLDIRSVEAAEIARAANMLFVEDHCTKVVHMHLADPLV